MLCIQSMKEPCLPCSFGHCGCLEMRCIKASAAKIVQLGQSSARQLLSINFVASSRPLMAMFKLLMIYNPRKRCRCSDSDLPVCFVARDTAAKLLGITVTVMQQSTAEELLVDLSNKFPTAAKAADSKLTYESQHGALAAVGCILAQCQSGSPSPSRPLSTVVCHACAYQLEGLVVPKIVVRGGRQLHYEIWQ